MWIQATALIVAFLYGAYLLAGILPTAVVIAINAIVLWLMGYRAYFELQAGWQRRYVFALVIAAAALTILRIELPVIWNLTLLAAATFGLAHVRLPKREKAERPLFGELMPA
ncbi:hypothetical protein HY642_03330 [Candidatus Woesearchaeota archaeon]|nr:hypothetical protein [Candidatus Woesearchaeota archaeon]